MRSTLTRLVLTVLFSLFATSVATVLLYFLPVLDYVGYQTQIPDILIGYAIGALLFSSAGTAVGLFTRRPVLYGLVASAVLAVVLAFAYRMTGITDNRDLIIGAFASQSFALFFSALFQYFRSDKRKLVAAGISVLVFTLLNVVIFLAMALIYLDFGQAYLPNILVSLETLCAVLGLAVIILFLLGKPKLRPT